MIKAVIFDMDGVLVAAKEWHYEALNRALACFDCHISREDHLARYDGLPTRKKLEMLSKNQGLSPDLHNIVNEKKQAFTLEVIHELCRPYKPHQEALSALKSKGYRLALASNSVRPTVDLIMQKTALFDYMDVIISATDVARPKPDPEIYTTTIGKLGVLPHECLVIEDNINGIQAAQAAGAHLLVVEEINEVNLNNIMQRINVIESGELLDATCEIN